VGLVADPLEWGRFAELEIAAFQGKTFATLINTFAAGKSA